jgi:uncharacterized protein YjiS (DUF1127 family)
MAIIELPAPCSRVGQVPHHRTRGAPSHLARRVLATSREWRRRARDRAELARLDDRTLEDIGLTRADAEFLSNKPFWRE